MLTDCLANFLIGEGKLESFLEEVPPLEANVAKARFGLIEVKRFLNVAVTKVSSIACLVTSVLFLFDLILIFLFHFQQPDESLDANLLLGKLNYAMGYYDAALQHYNAAKLQSLSEKPLSLRSLRIVAESFAIKGGKIFCVALIHLIRSIWQENLIPCCFL